MATLGKILWLDDEPLHLNSYAHFLRDHGYAVELIASVNQALRRIRDTAYDLVILDVMIAHSPHELPLKETKGGEEAGIVLARKIKVLRPDTPILACSVREDLNVIAWFAKHAAGYLRKRDLNANDRLLARVSCAINREPLPPKVFIVHGHADALKWELKNYLQNTLGLPEPIILHEQPSLGRTLIEKFEQVADDVDLVFVLLTPDDKLADMSAPGTELRRARQNVIFEMGYFYGKLQRGSGRVFLLHKGPLELPSDISGVVYVDITNGVESAAGVLGRELREYTHLSSRS